MAIGRERWQQSWTLVLAALAAAGGLAPVWLLPRLMLGSGGGAFVVAWMVMVAVIGLPLVWYELSLGVVLQGALPDALRRSDRRWEWLGWWGTALAGGLVIVSLGTAAVLAWHTLRAGLVVISGTVSVAPPAAQAAAASPALIGAVVLIVALMVGVVSMLAAGGAKRLGATLHASVAAVVVLLALGFVLGVGHAAGTAGLLRALQPDWSALASTRCWLQAAGAACATVLGGCGLYTVLGSQRPRTSDVGGNAATLLVVLVAFQLLAACAIACLMGRAAQVGGLIQDPVASWVPLIITEPLLAVDPAVPRLAALAVASTCGALAMALALGAAVLIHVVVTAFVDRGGDRVRLVLRCAVWAGVCAALVASAQGAWWLAAGGEALLTWGLLPAGALLLWVGVWQIGTEGLQDHTSAYSSIRTATWWSAWLGVVTPVLLTAMWWGRLLNQMATHADSPPVWLLGPCALLALAAPVAAWLVARANRPETDGLNRRSTQMAVAVAICGAIALLTAAVATDSRRSARADLRELAGAWVEGRSWDAPGGMRHPLAVALEAWNAGDDAVARSAVALWRAQPASDRDREAAEVLALRVADEALDIIAADGDRVRVLQALALLRGLKEAGVVNSVSEAWLLAWPSDAQLINDLDAAAARFATGDASSEAVLAAALAWRALGAEVPLRLWAEAPDPIGTSARDAAEGLQRHAAGLAARLDVSPRDRAVVAAVLIEADMWQQMPLDQRRWLASARLGMVEPGPALATGMGIVLVLIASLVAVLRRVGGGPRPIDPQADTLEHVEPIDVDSQAVTLEDEYLTDEPTTSGSTPIPTA
ncbi:MAG: hypothetical protein PF961_10365 [Planctomycetota bacterium]|jgi:NSS family neurotransmitter:Na+ symporter|nr:hypothetical protein [Planctomycetota bacterium]